MYHVFTWMPVTQHRTLCHRWLRTCLSECWRDGPMKRKWKIILKIHTTWELTELFPYNTTAINTTVTLTPVTRSDSPFHQLIHKQLRVLQAKAGGSQSSATQWIKWDIRLHHSKTKLPVLNYRTYISLCFHQFNCCISDNIFPLHKEIFPVYSLLCITTTNSNWEFLFAALLNYCLFNHTLHSLNTMSTRLLTVWTNLLQMAFLSPLEEKITQIKMC